VCFDAVQADALVKPPKDIELDSCPITDLEGLYNTSAEKGMSSGDAAARLKEDGKFSSDSNRGCGGEAEGRW
jgi:hypothetical protein